MATQVRTIVDQADAEAVHTQFDRVVSGLEDKYPDAAEHLDIARDELLASHRLSPRDLAPNLEQQPPGAIEQRIPSAHRRRGDLPRRSVLIRLVGAVLAEQSDEWTEDRRYMSLELLATSRIRIVSIEPDPTPGEPTVTTEKLTA